MKILLVEDDPTIVFGLKKYLINKGHVVVAAFTLAEAQQLINERFDICVLDIGLPDGTGYSLSEWIGKTYGIPILFLSARDDEASIVEGFNHGGQDYMTKPFRLAEFEKRLEVIYNRSTETRMRHKGLLIDTQSADATMNGAPLYLSVIEYKLLILLVRNKERVLSRSDIIEQVWKETDDNTLSVTMKRLRNKIEPEISIQTMHGKGYQLQ